MELLTNLNILILSILALIHAIKIFNLKRHVKKLRDENKSLRAYVMDLHGDINMLFRKQLNINEGFSKFICNLAGVDYDKTTKEDD